MSKKYTLEEQLKQFGIEISQITGEIERRAKESIKLLQQQAHAKIVEKATEKLHSTRHIYIANLGMISPNDNVYVVYLRKGAEWIEDGMPPHEMIDDLTSGPKARVAKDGSRYNIIPFKHNKPPQHTSRAQMKIQEIVKEELTKRGLNKVIKASSGQPIFGKVASLKDELTGEGMPTNKFGRPILAGLTIYQKPIKTSTGKIMVQRDIMTFRVASTKQKGTGMWHHPGLKAANIFEEVEKEIDKMWDEMLKEILKDIKIEGNL